MGGTLKWCKNCKSLQMVKIIPAEKYDNFSSKSRNFWFDNGSGEEENRIHYFQRKARCLHCDHEWCTVEYDYVDMVNLTLSYKDLIKKNVGLKDKIKSYKDVVASMEKTQISLTIDYEHKKGELR